MGFGAKKPKKTAEERALEAAQARELDRTQNDINEKKRRTLRAQYTSRGSLLSGSERGVRPGEVRLTKGAATPSGTTGRTGLAGRGGTLGGGGRTVRASGGRKQSLLR